MTILKKALVGVGATAGLAYLVQHASEGDWPEISRRRTILITGAASGIGLATAKLFLAKGWFVGALDLDEDALKRAFGNSPSVKMGLVDVCDSDLCEAAVKAFLEATPDGKLDVLFNCAGILSIGPFDELSLARQQQEIQVNCTGVVNMTHKALPALKESRGRIVTMASASAIGGIPNHAVYAATKAFVYSFTEALRSELCDKYGVRVADVSVSYVKSPMTDSQVYDGVTFSKKEAFASVENVASCVFDAAHKCTKSNLHFYVDAQTKLAFRISNMSRALGLNLHTNLIEKSQISSNL